MADKTVKALYGENGLDDLEKTLVTLVMYNQSEFKPVGKKCFKVVNPRNKKSTALIEFHIVSGACKSILGLRASEHLQLLTINKQNILTMVCSAFESGVSTKESCLHSTKMCSQEMEKWTDSYIWRLKRMYSQFSCQLGEYQLP